MKPGRIILAAVLGLLTGLFLGLDLVLFGVVPLNSVVVTLLMAVGLVGGGVLGALASKRLATPAGSVPAAPPPAAPPAPQSFTPPPPPRAG